MTLIIIAWVALFTLPKVYEMNKTQIDANLEIVRTKLAEISSNATSTPLHHFGNHYCLVYPNGELEPEVLAVRYKKCHMDFGSWTSHGDLIDIQLYNNQKQVEPEPESGVSFYQVIVHIQINRCAKNHISKNVLITLIFAFKSIAYLKADPEQFLTYT
ncbi:hypothetical protein NQ317_009257 [Molorchus minor]|uniref:Reticulon domain-containing protein n=1 Tax=Molorchus minor TaxID=1323400 RepID=A0ABQ9JCM6_9CUCU|nr:hypothetical protein NQ317_009257 [Molorchus minor]